VLRQINFSQPFWAERGYIGAEKDLKWRCGIGNAPLLEQTPATF
jgi:hypothetical protein